MEDSSLSQLRYTSLGRKVTDNVSLYHIIDRTNASGTDLPQFSHGGNEYELNSKHEWKENIVQSVLSNALVGRDKVIGKCYYVHATHRTQLPFLDDLRPDFVVSTIKSDTVLGEYQVAFMIDAKSSDVSPSSDKSVGQAAAYALRLMEISCDVFRRSTIVIVTNLMSAAVVQVLRETNGFKIRKAVTSASEALRVAFNASANSLGLINFIDNIPLNGESVFPIKYLGRGASAVVYATDTDVVAKFYTGSDSGLALEELRHEQKVLDYLNEELDQQTTDKAFVLQRVEGDHLPENGSLIPTLLLSPLGTVASPHGFPDFSLDFLLLCLDTLQFAHSMNVIHNDVRPENIIRLATNGKWMLIDWAAAWICDPAERTQNMSYYKEYRGCVTFAADSVLQQLIEESSGPNFRDDASASVHRSCSVNASEVTDCIALLRTTFMFTTRVSKVAHDDLRSKRLSNNFVGIQAWWREHLPPLYKKFEQNLELMFREGRGDIYEEMRSFMLHNISATL
jgi:hypothetical protein